MEIKKNWVEQAKVDTQTYETKYKNSLDDNDNLMEYDIDYDKTLDTYNLCEKFVEGMSIEGATKTKVLSLLKQVYLQNSK